MLLNDKEKELKALSEWVDNELEKISRKYPVNTHGLDGPAAVEEKKIHIEMNKRLTAILEKYNK